MVRTSPIFYNPEAKPQATVIVPESVLIDAIGYPHRGDVIPGVDNPPEIFWILDAPFGVAGPLLQITPVDRVAGKWHVWHKTEEVYEALKRRIEFA